MLHTFCFLPCLKVTEDSPIISLLFILLKKKNETKNLANKNKEIFFKSFVVLLVVLLLFQ